MDGVLKSWAVPNGPSLDPADRRLAVMTEDHPLMYLEFEGVIPRGQYGAGEMIVWDRGTYVREGSVEQGKLTLTFQGAKLHGSWTLVKTSKDWLLIKRQDEHARPGVDILADDASVISGRTIEDLKIGLTPAPRESAPMPTSLAPMLPSPSDRPFSHPDFIFEPKLDGYRVIACVDDGKVRLLARSGLEATGDYPCVVDDLATQPGKVIFDGEIVALDDRGRPSFDLLKDRLGQIKRSAGRASAARIPLVYYVFDVLYADGQDLRTMPLERRKTILGRVLRSTRCVRPVEHVVEHGLAFYEAAAGLGLEGVIAKHRASLYEAGRRSQQWLKIKGIVSDEFVVGGFTAGNGARADTLGALLLGQYDDDGRLIYAGRAGTGWDDRGGVELRRLLDPLRTDASPFNGPIDPGPVPTWVRPELVAEVKFVEWTKERRLRAPVFLRLRADKPAATVTSSPSSLEPPLEASRNAGAEVGDTVRVVLSQLEGNDKQLVLEVDGARITFTNLDKKLWPGFTKRDYVRYLARVSPYLLPHLRDRVVTLIRFPEGIDGERFYQKHQEHGRPEFIETVRVFSDHNGQEADFLLCQNLPTLLWFGQMSALEIHSYYTRITPDPSSPGTTDFGGSLESVLGSLFNYPDFVVFDLDPVRAPTEQPRFERGKFARVCQAALWLKELLDALGLPGFVKSTGRSGLHVYVPIERRFDYEVTRTVSMTLAQFLKKSHPKEIALDWAVARRTGDVFIDTNQNVRKKSLASIYSARATPLATVSTPLRWDEVATLDPTALTIATVPERLAAIGDVWGGILEARGDLAAKLGL